MNIAANGTGYVELFPEVLQARKHHVTAADIPMAAVDLFNRRRSSAAIRQMVLIGCAGFLL